MQEAQNRILPLRRPGKFPDAGVTVFSVMSQLALQSGAVNLGQGFPDFQPDQALLDAVSRALANGQNQYAPMTGLPALRQAIARKIADFGGCSYDPDTEITVTAGATEALTSSILALVHPGDRVLVFEPVYDSYVPAIELAGGQAVRIPLGVDFLPDWVAVEQALGGDGAGASPETAGHGTNGFSAGIARADKPICGVIFNSPHNPGASVWSHENMLRLQALCVRHGLWVIADEVYEHMVFDGQAHRSVAHYPQLAACSVLVSSFGKSLHVTGWKIAYAAAPAHLSRELRMVHQYNTFSVATPLQAGIADYLSAHPHVLHELPAFYQRKRDHFRAGLAQLPLRLLPCAGTYFQIVDYSAISDQDDVQFSRWLTETIGVACIPLSAFFRSPPPDMRLVRFCFAKQENTLDEALRRLRQLS